MIKEASGSITILASLSIMLISSLLFSLIEAGRYWEMDKTARASAEAGIESLFANYEPTLWETYHLLLLEGGASHQTSNADREAYIKELLEDDMFRKSDSLLQYKVNEIQLNNIVYITDDAGKAFEAAVTAYMGNSYTFGLYDYLMSQMEKVALFDGKKEDLSQEVKESKIAYDNVNGDDADALKAVTAVEARGILAMVLPRGSTVSGKSINIENSVLNREINVGDGRLSGLGIFDTPAVLSYFQTYFSRYGEVKEDHGLDYELEYILCGKGTDEENLRAIVDRILMLREAANMGYLLTDAAKVAEAETLAIAICAFVAQPELVEPVKYSLLAAWAYAESILDMRALLNQKKVPLIKNSALWTSDLSNIPNLLNGYEEAISSESGFSYEMYLLSFLALAGTKVRSLRALDAMELTVRREEMRSDFRIDNMILEASIELAVRYHTAFFGMEAITESMGRNFYIKKGASYSYRKAGV